MGKKQRQATPADLKLIMRATDMIQDDGYVATVRALGADAALAGLMHVTATEATLCGLSQREFIDAMTRTINGHYAAAARNQN